MVRECTRPSRTSRVPRAVGADRARVERPVVGGRGVAVASEFVHVTVSPTRHRHVRRREREARRSRPRDPRRGRHPAPIEAMASNRHHRCRPGNEREDDAGPRQTLPAAPGSTWYVDLATIGSRAGSSSRREYPHRPMATTHRPDTLARERAHELVRSWDGRPGALGPLLGRVSSVDQVGVEERVDSAEEALDQEGLEAVGPRPRDPDDRPDDARGEGHARARSGRSRRRRSTPSPATRRSPASPRSASTRRSSRRRRTPSRARPSRSPRSRPASRRARRSATSRSPRRGPPPRPAPTRSTWSSTAARS